VEEVDISAEEMGLIYKHYAMLHSSIAAVVDNDIVDTDVGTSVNITAGQRSVLLSTLYKIENRCKELFAAFQPYCDLQLINSYFEPDIQPMPLPATASRYSDLLNMDVELPDIDCCSSNTDDNDDDTL